MKILLALALAAVVALPAAAHDFGARVPARAPGAAKAPGTATPPPADPEVIRQGGDTIADAVRIPIPTIDLAGTTAGYNDDYDESCPGPGAAPDVVYSIVPEDNMFLTIDMCGSSYDTKIWVYDTDLNRIACNDDYYGIDDPCGAYVSKIEDLYVEAGREYWIIVDGYGTDFGDYLIDVFEDSCELECPAFAVLEGEPPLMNDYVDTHNGGCNTDLVEPPFQMITSPVFCGVSGRYFSDGAAYRDTDWFLIEIPAGGVLEITGDAEQMCFMFEIGPQDCGQSGVLQDVIIGRCNEETMVITGAPGDTVWFWVGAFIESIPYGVPDVFEFNYVLWLNLDPVAVEDHSWTEVKALFD